MGKRKKLSPHNGRFLRHRFLTEGKKRRNTKQFTKKNPRCQRGGVRGVANQDTTTERTNLQTKRCSNDEAAALRKNHVVRLKGVRLTIDFRKTPRRQRQGIRRIAGQDVHGRERATKRPSDQIR